MASVKEELKRLKDLKEFVLLANVNAKNYEKTNTEIIRHLIEDMSIPGVYATLNKPYYVMKDNLKKKGIDVRLIIFIDAVTKTAGGDVKKTKDCLFIGSPENLSDISIA